MIAENAEIAEQAQNERPPGTQHLCGRHPKIPQNERFSKDPPFSERNIYMTSKRNASVKEGRSAGVCEAPPVPTAIGSLLRLVFQTQPRSADIEGLPSKPGE